MRNQSNLLVDGSYAPITLNPEFPVTEPEYTERDIIAPVPPHIHNCFEIGYCHKGTGVFIIEGKL